MCWYNWKMSQRAILIGIIGGLLLMITNRFQVEVNLSALVVGSVVALSAYLAQDAEHKQEKL